MTGTTTATASSAVGSYNIVPTAAGANLANYTVTVVPGTLTITAATLTVTANECDTELRYGESDLQWNGERRVERGHVHGDGHEHSDGVQWRGQLQYRAFCAGTNIGNYTVIPVNGTLTVTGGVLTVTANNATRSYGSANPTFTGTVSGALNGDTFTVTDTTTATASSAVGSYNIVPSAAGANLANYTVAPVNGTLTVTRGMLTVTANNATRSYGPANPTFTGTVSGALNGDTFTVTGATTATGAVRWAATILCLLQRVRISGTTR